MTVTINNVDPARVGFNDRTSVALIGGNAGVTLGELRLRVFQFAADVWASILDSSVGIVVQATFSPLPCDMTFGVLEAAGPIRLYANFPSDVERRQADVWYPATLSNVPAVQDLSPGPADAELSKDPITIILCLFLMAIVMALEFPFRQSVWDRTWQSYS